MAQARPEKKRDPLREQLDALAAHRGDPRTPAAMAALRQALRSGGGFLVAAAADQRGYALIQPNAKQVLVVHEGEELAPGIRLAEVHPDHIILEHNDAGTRETLTWPGKHAAVKPPAPQTNK